MIEEGFSPYFTKYGNAVFHHDTYRDAERRAQQQHIGVWDQIAANGSEMRNYAALGAWWDLRASIIDEYRRIEPKPADLLDSRLDFEEIEQRAQNGDTVTVFTALESIQPAGQQHALVRIGSVHQPFNLFIRNVNAEPGRTIVRLLENRYIPSGESHPRRSYSYVHGQLKMFNGNPEIELTSPGQLTDQFAG
jgi:micrococcal nuclease